jgi:alginate O-acetyltransferase complex protein AlgI
LYAALLLAITTIFTFLVTYKVVTIQSPSIREWIGRTSVPFAFLLIVILNLVGFISTLTGTIANDDNNFSFLFVGLPFYLLCAAAYISELSTQRNHAKKLDNSFLDLSLYLALPFKLLSGPIEGPALITQFNKISLKIASSRMVIGFTWIALGLFMKFVIANRLAPSALLTSTEPIISLICAAIFELKFYFDFAGYSFIAFGCAILFNLKIINNFNHPFTTTNVVHFWHAWHIGLGKFLQKYILLKNLSLFDSRNSKAIFAGSIFLVSAMWHGGTANYLFWGLFHGVVYVTYIQLVKYKKIPQLAGLIGMLTFFVFGRLLAIDPVTARLLERLRNIFDPTYYFVGTHHFQAIEDVLYSINYRPIVLAFAFILIEFYQVKIQKKTIYHFFRRPIPIAALFFIFIFFGINSGELLYARI